MSSQQHKALPYSVRKLSSSRYMRTLYSLLLVSSIGAVACQPAATHPAHNAQTVLYLTAGSQLVASADTLLQTQHILNLRLQREGFGANAVQIDGEQLRVTLPSMSSDKLQYIKEQLLLRRGLISLVPLIEKSPVFAHLRDAAKLYKHKEPILVQQESWRGPAKELHHTHVVLHSNKRILLGFLGQIQQQPKLALTHGEHWAIKRHKSGGWAAYLLAGTEALHIQKLRHVEHSVEINQPGSVSVGLTLQAADSHKLRALTTRHLGNRLFIKIDRTVHSAPVIMAAIRGSALRLSLLSSGSTHPLIRLLGAGALPMEVQLKMKL